MKSNNIYNINTKPGIRDITSGIWTAFSKDKILLGMVMIGFLAIVGYAMDKNYSLNMGNDSIDIHP